MSPTSSASMPGERDRLRRVVARDEQRRDGREDQRRDRRVGPEHEHPRRAEDRVADEAGDRRVQAGDRGQPGQLGVGHALRHEDRGQHDTGDEVGPQPPALVSPRGADSGHDLLEAPDSGLP